MIEHPVPTPATAKLLYAHAVRCAFAGCEEPLYREDGQSGTWILNSRICHICARSEGGPRWDPNQSAEENRAESNLLLMCLAHASTIDDPRAVAAFPVKLLNDWKAAQLDRHFTLREGWPLTNSMAQRALAASFAKVAVAINNSSVDLGGKGGSAPGSGGGGGGAIGPGSYGGRGGQGGTIEVRRDLSISEDLPGDCDRDDVRAPGSGGGGTGAYGPNAIGGDGGNGGNCVVDGFPVEPGDTLEIEVGGSGPATTLPGQHGAPGGDSVVIHKSADGAIRRIIRTGGGIGGKSGRLADDWVAVSSQDLEDGFCVSTLMPLNAAELRDGLLYILGGGWSKIYLPSIPSLAAWNVVCVASWLRLLPNRTRGIQLYLSNPDRAEVACVALPLSAEGALGNSCIWLSQLGANLDKIGFWYLGVRSGEFRIAEITIDVQLNPQV